MFNDLRNLFQIYFMFLKTLNLQFDNIYDEIDLGKMNT